MQRVKSFPVLGVVKNSNDSNVSLKNQASSRRDQEEQKASLSSVKRNFTISNNNQGSDCEVDADEGVMNISNLKNYQKNVSSQKAILALDKTKGKEKVCVEKTPTKAERNKLIDAKINELLEKHLAAKKEEQEILQIQKESRLEFKTNKNLIQSQIVGKQPRIEVNRQEINDYKQKIQKELEKLHPRPAERRRFEMIEEEKEIPKNPKERKKSRSEFRLGSKKSSQSSILEIPIKKIKTGAL